ncbi:MAG: 4-hydroxy-tetrahydrodipicolinate synthase [Bacteroidales bacterium]|nr:4-hydroxy-tetrahydrodipicolinate synthase [Bacteroidales bacterium]
MADARFTGTGVAIVTPFNIDYSVDFPSLEKITDYCITNGVSYIVVLGTTGESATLTKEEKKEVVKTVVKASAGRVPIVIGIGGNFTQEVVETIKNADFQGIEAILSVSPYYNKPNQNGLYEHYKVIAQVSPLPIILYNVPGRTGMNMTAHTVVKLAHDFKNIIAVKEASGNLVQVMEILRDKPADFSVISGDDALTLPMISVGATGVISVIANSHPKEFSIMVDEAIGGNYQLARKIHLSLIETINLLFVDGSPGGVKAILEMRKLCQNVVRLPLMPVSDNIYKKIKEEVFQAK